MDYDFVPGENEEYLNQRREQFYDEFLRLINIYNASHDREDGGDLVRGETLDQITILRAQAREENIILDADMWERAEIIDSESIRVTHTGEQAIAPDEEDEPDLENAPEGIQEVGREEDTDEEDTDEEDTEDEEAGRRLFGDDYYDFLQQAEREGEIREALAEGEEPPEGFGELGEMYRRMHDLDLPEEEHVPEEEMEPRPGHVNIEDFPEVPHRDMPPGQPPDQPPDDPNDGGGGRDRVIQERSLVDGIFNTGGVYDPNLEKTMRRRMGALGDLSSTHRPIRQTPNNTDVLGHHSVKGQLGLRGITLGNHFMLKTDSVPEVCTNPIKSIRTKYYRISKINRKFHSFFFND
jgi:hypothetical protein